MLDIRATGYVSPLAEVEFTDVPLTVRISNVADETALITGTFCVYNDTTGELFFTSVIAPFSLGPGLSADATALTPFSPPAPLDDTYFVLFHGHACNNLVPRGISFFLGAFHFDVKPGPLGEPPEAHAPTHEQSGADPIETSDLGTASLDDTLTLHPDGAGGLSWAPTVPAAHAASHEDGGADEIDVSGLHGTLADAQIAAPHAASHLAGEADAIEIASLGTAELDDSLVLAPDGAGGVEFRAESGAGPTTTLYAATDFLCSIYQFPCSDYPWYVNPLDTSITKRQNAGPNHPGVATLLTGELMESSVVVLLDNNSICVAGTETTNLIFRPLLLDFASMKFGLMDNDGATPNGILFDMHWGPTPGTVVGKCTKASTTTITSTSYVISQDVWYRFRIVVNSNASQVDFYILNEAGSILWHDSITTNIPTGPEQVGCELYWLYTTFLPGYQELLDLDLIDFSISRPLTR